LQNVPGYFSLDVCLLFFRASQEQAVAIKDVISAFEKGSGQLLRAEKCSLLFSDNCPDTIQQQVKQTLEVFRDNFKDNYLGYSTPEGRMKKGISSLQKKDYPRN
jgi:hypothetical protein